MADGDVAEDLRLPQTVIGRLVKDALPPGVIISKDARIAIARAATVFILHAATYAQECAVSNKRKTVTALDVLNAVRVLECEELEKPVKEAVEIWKANKQQRNEEVKKRKAGRGQNNDPSMLEILRNASQRDGISDLANSTTASDESGIKKMLLDVIMDDDD
ncbi:DNA polymerase epsilon p17 subunit, putative [Brugia malayi]|uniref:DNA polymerase epsilon subunit 3 n=1 Tax=Brugia malayi TaxID=6279 RepID=A0A0K0JYP2_BRUMA|nr:DNA polymerase epsilon p17 subunit, putative [Brugia malayi]CDP93467.1 Bm9269 [Brugia malayi]VIO99972.1 DNA polymerase epsilon p17 subunit, putative [Brugia malayi]